MSDFAFNVVMEKKMKVTPVLAAVLWLVPAVAGAGQLAFIVDAMAIEAASRHTNKGWEDMEKIKRVKWQWPYYESGAHGSTMVGKTKVGKSKNPNVGRVAVTVDGARTVVSLITVSISNEHVDIEDLGKAKVTPIETSCDIAGAVEVVAFYEFEKPGYKPLYVSYASSWGASGEAGSVTFKIAYTLADAMGKDCSLVR